MVLFSFSLQYTDPLFSHKKERATHNNSPKIIKRMKGKLFLCAMAAMLALVGCSENEESTPSKIESARINPATVTLATGGTYQLKIVVVPEDVSGLDVAWSSSDNNVATVSEKGLVTGIKAGAATVSALVEGITTTCAVTVSSIPVEFVSITPDDLTLRKGKTGKLTATILPAAAASQTIEWSSSDELIVAVDAEGNLTSIATGEATVTATVGGKSATCDVFVEGINLSQTKVMVTAGRALFLTAEIVSEKADQYLIEWSSSNEDIATVDPYEGFVSTTAVGEVVITATAGEMIEECRITVTEFIPAEGVGDFFYSDGTRSSELDPTKTPVGIVFWLGDPTASDPTLKKEHPDCTHGLVVSLKEFRLPYLTEEGAEALKISGYTTVGAWTDAHAGDYESIFNERWPYIIRGYNNTEALEFFNAAPENTNCLLQPIVKLQEYRQSVPAPTGTSDWYMPSLQELSLLCSGLYEENLDEKNYADIINRNALFINDQIDQITDASRLNTEENDNHVYWSSTEKWTEMVPRIMSRINMARGNYGTDILENPNSVRFVFAF